MRRRRKRTPLWLTSPEAIVEMKRGVALDPLSPLYTAWLGGQYWMVGQNEEAIAQARKSLELEPDFPVGLYVLGGAHADMGRYAEAIATHEKTAAKYPTYRWTLARTYALAGWTDEARKILARIGRGHRVTGFSGSLAYSRGLRRPG